MPINQVELLSKNIVLYSSQYNEAKTIFNQVNDELVKAEDERNVIYQKIHTNSTPVYLQAQLAPQLVNYDNNILPPLRIEQKEKKVIMDNYFTALENTKIALNTLTAKFNSEISVNELEETKAKEKLTVTEQSTLKKKIITYTIAGLIILTFVAGCFWLYDKYKK